MKTEWKPKEDGEELLKHLIDTSIGGGNTQLMIVLVGNKSRIKESLDSMTLYLTSKELKKVDPRVVLDSTKTAHKKIKQAMNDGEYDGSKVILCDAGDRECKKWCTRGIKGITDSRGFPNGLLIVTGRNLPDESIALYSPQYGHRMIYIEMMSERYKPGLASHAQVRISARSFMTRIYDGSRLIAKEREAKQK